MRLCADTNASRDGSTATLGSARAVRSIRSGARALAALAASLIVLGLALDGHAIDRTARSGMRVLFIGNSYTRFNDLPRMVAELSASARRGPVLHTSREAQAGFDLRRHWHRRRVRDRIENGRFATIVIQGHSLAPIRHSTQFAEYARRFSAHASSSGARLILFQTWARHPRNGLYRSNDPSSPEEMLERIDAFYGQLARDLHVSVAPVGRAWQRAASELPEVRLHRGDRGTHPSLAGSYLSACVLYGTLTGVDPREASWRPWQIPRRQAARIRAVAAASLAH